ncbi:SDR family oxidoreductase [Celeribacter halophilus]|uniref:Nucleoside-diphosphate-sugar epimerase n=1 Tax=Celeribacter halophilus TaxID=576117 RepID=A0A1I3WNX1_9RHOB|nr:SDR family oxidoreductase [Celeribacter halophilus]PZX06053.1 nucleoside-diphosphate-sugar epimerase [Celeribacter halophilus]SFK08879.1 Nucleoside-diphosphate-sugar epimerase [Celeribacter halophilus]
MTRPKLFSFGHGYSAQMLARSLIPQGWDIVGTTRNTAKAQQFDSAGVQPVLLGTDPLPPRLAGASHLLISAGPDAQGDPFLRDYRDVLKEAAPTLEWVGYLSTTGVYGDHGGDWVDEKTPLTPSTKRGVMRMQAEADWRQVALDLNLNLSIFRLAGIYGPERGPFAKVRAGTARRIVKQGQVFSRIHVEDIAQALEASINRPETGGTYNICDDLPAPPEDVIGYAAELLGLPLPPVEPFETAEMSPMARSFYAENKKVRNDRMKNRLGVKLIYPDYKTGLKALLALDQ